MHAAWGGQGKEEGATQGKHTTGGLSPLLISRPSEVCRFSSFKDVVGRWAEVGGLRWDLWASPQGLAASSETQREASCRGPGAVKEMPTS